MWNTDLTQAPTDREILGRDKDGVETAMRSYPYRGNPVWWMMANGEVQGVFNPVEWMEP